MLKQEDPLAKLETPLDKKDIDEKAEGLVSFEQSH